MRVKTISSKEKHIYGSIGQVFSGASSEVVANVAEAIKTMQVGDHYDWPQFGLRR